MARYDKIHLFRFDNGRERYDESRVIECGARAGGVRAARRAAGTAWRIGMSVCYDLRFPELYRALKADVLLVPSAFTYTTGQAHWELLLRARAVENLAYVVAPAQGGVHENGRRTWGHTHGGRSLGRGAGAAGRRRRASCMAELTPQRQAQVRAQLPALEHRVPVKPQSRRRASGVPPLVRACAAVRRARLRWSLWALLVALVLALLVTLVWLAGRYEAARCRASWSGTRPMRWATSASA